MKRVGYRGAPDAPHGGLPIRPRTGFALTFRPAPAPTERRSDARHPDHLFAALDGSELRTQESRFDLEVYSVTDQRSGRWVQLGLRGVREYLVTLRLPIESGLAEATTALSRWLAEVAIGREPEVLPIYALVIA